MRQPVPPCVSRCPRRSPTCHNPITCPAWGRYQAALAEYKAVLAAGRRELDDFEIARNGYLEIFSVSSTWYWYAGGAVAGLVVAYVAMNGYDGLYEDLIKHLKGLAGSANGNG